MTGDLLPGEGASWRDVVDGSAAWWLGLGDNAQWRDEWPRDAAVVSDPPYGMAADTNSLRFGGGRVSNNRRPGDGRDWPVIHGDASPFDPAPWLTFSRVVLFGYHHFATRLPVGTVLVWVKKGDHLFGTFLSDAELAWCKGGHGVYCWRKNFTAMTRMAEGGGECLHPTQKPAGLMAWCMDRAKVLAGDVVIDGYAGSGTTGVACIQTGRRFIGAEIDPTYHATARARLGLAYGARQPSLFDAAALTAEAHP